MHKELLEESACNSQFSPDEIISIYKNNVPNHNITRIIGQQSLVLLKKILKKKILLLKRQIGHPKSIRKENQKLTFMFQLRLSEKFCVSQLQSLFLNKK